MNEAARTCPGDTTVMRGALRRVRRQPGISLAFGGPVREGRLRLTELDGARTQALRGLQIGSGLGLGGRVIATGLPSRVQDYLSAPTITHDFDRPVLVEGIRSIVAAPVTVGSEVRYVLYAAVREDAALGERAMDRLVHAGRLVADEIRFQEEVQRRVESLVGRVELEQRSALSGLVREEIRDVQAELRRLAAEMADPDVRDRLRDVSTRLSRLGEPADDVQARATLLSPRELDVLGEIALGCTNVEVAARLALSTETVKAYLRSVMRKLGARSRHEAVVTARRAGLLL